ncbi:hypothetical protein DPMN_018701 [Dreissena polymorpha]|uniref:Uncharacterized protein n=1 Tax=Dreissena polymorpha TaxID=45954 RepID=A0A9D4NDP1_DREPO|nr:hypothetical protein DPMN_043598 [Dreissena polymorpha]KAH3737038.1 hypothetical protein DPMN_043614 [Dreissena polymorpha]KAH3878755.1 hypothetical protein DPMN_002654 [Dreissena polymorpha]KAH3894512.1 hypothetical protein DPMN_018670 [Dreissena polymorpha]KAH3894543.1 hypothetical protein DPMN_018701 [Dreissena polymorpha]
MTTGRINQIATVVYVRVRTPACESGNCSLALSLGLLRRRNVFLGLAASVLVHRLLLRAFRRWYGGTGLGIAGRPPRSIRLLPCVSTCRH